MSNRQEAKWTGRRAGKQAGGRASRQSGGQAGGPAQVGQQAGMLVAGGRVGQVRRRWGGGRSGGRASRDDQEGGLERRLASRRAGMGLRAGRRQVTRVGRRASEQVNG